jgi:hypothetical protein
MDLMNIQSQPRQTPFAVEWFFTIGEDTIDDIDFKKIAKTILKKEKEILKKYPVGDKGDGGTALGDQSLTSRFQSFNVFQWEDEEIQKLKDKLYKKYIEFLQILNVPRMNCSIQCWANVMRDGEQIKSHMHGIGPYSYLSGHIVVQCNDTGTVYTNPFEVLSNVPLEYTSKNEVGKLTFFQRCIPHRTTVHNGKKERITIAFDFIVEEQVRQTPDISNLLAFDEVL